MALVLKDRVLETCTSPGTGTITLLGAVTGYQAFSTVGNGNTCYYAIADQNGANWECGIGTYSSGTLARTTVLSSSNAGSLTNFSTGSQNVFLTYPSERSVNLSSAALTSGRVTYATTDGLLTDSAGLTWDGSFLTAASIKDTALTSGRVTYAGASGLLSDSASLTFDGTILKIYGAANEMLRLDTVSTAYDAAIRFFQAGVQKANIQAGVGVTGGGLMIFSSGSTPIVFGSSSEAMRISSAGLVGIGTSSPADMLDVSGNARVGQGQISSDATVGTLGIYGGNSSGSANAQLKFFGKSVSNTGATYEIGRISGGSFGPYSIEGGLQFSTASNNGSNVLTLTERMRIDSSGNLGLGVTPSAWGSGSKGFQVLKGGLWHDNSQYFSLVNNAYYDGTNWKYISTAAPSQVAQVNGEVRFYNASSGTAGNTISFTQAMTLDVSGRLGIGTSSPSSPLTVSTTGVNSTVQINSTDGAGGYGAVLSLNNTGTGGREYYISSTSNSDGGVGGGKLKFYDVAAGTTRMMIDSSGNLILNSATPAYLASTSNLAQISINRSPSTGAIFNASQSAAFINIDGVSGGSSIQFATATANNTQPAERMRIDSSGNLLLGTTSQFGFGTGKLVVEQSAATFAATMQNSNAIPYGMYIKYSGAAPNNTSNEFIYCHDGTLRFSVMSNGGISNYATNNVILSDSREKTNFAPAKSYLDVICAIPVQTFNYIDQNLEEDDGLTLGVTAQDVQSVAPELVSEGNWGTKDEPKMRLQIYQTDLQYALMKALQELKAEFDAYKATHP